MLNKLYFLLGLFFIFLGILLIILSLGINKESKFTFVGLIGPFPIIITNDKISNIVIFAIFILFLIIILIYLLFFLY